jgi:hypothetical protein
MHHTSRRIEEELVLDDLLNDLSAAQASQS